MTITLARIDDRVIHGQTVTRWAANRPVQGILVVSDEVANDELRKKVLKAAAGKLKLGIYTVEDGIDKIEKGKNSSKDFFLISNSPKFFAELVRRGVNWGGVLNVGCMNDRPGAITVAKSCALDDNEYENFEYMYKNGIKLEFQIIPDDGIKDWPDIKKKYDALKL